MRYRVTDTEIWKDIAGYEGIYHVSNLGRVKSLDRECAMKNGVTRKKKGKVLKGSFDGKKRYLQVNLSVNGKARILLVHRLVAIAFVDGYKEGLEVDHKDCDTTNNKAKNLRWVNRSQNMRNPETYKKIIKYHKEVQSIPVIGVNKENNKIIRFNSVREAKRNGFKGIGENIHGRTRQCGGYVWRYQNDVQVQR